MIAAMLPQPAIDGVLILVLLLDLAMLAVARLASCIRIFAIQCLLLAVLPLAARQAGIEHFPIHELIILAGTIGLKVVLIPWLLRRTIRVADIYREIEPMVGFTSSVALGGLLVAGAFAVRTRLSVHATPVSPLLVPVAMSTLLIGLLIMVTRVKAISQVIGYLVLENGIYLFGLMLLRQMPLMIELGILLDVFVGVFVMAIVVHHIRRAFDHIDTPRLDQLRELVAESAPAQAVVAEGEE